MKRKKFEGVTNVVKFNYPKYLAAGIIAIIAMVLIFTTKNIFIFYLALFSQLSLVLMINSLIVSYLVYDYSDLYQLQFLNNISLTQNLKMVNISSGFDEIGDALESKFSGLNVINIDIYKALTKKEHSIQIANSTKSKRDRVQIENFKIPLDSVSADIIILFFAAHEIRDSSDRQRFFKEIKRILKPEAKVFIIEHHRDVNNFLAFNFGFLHFYSKKIWMDLFSQTGFKVSEITIENPWVKTYKLQHQ